MRQNHGNKFKLIFIVSDNLILETKIRKSKHDKFVKTKTHA